jgi:hypothetical protein
MLPKQPTSPPERFRALIVSACFVLLVVAATARVLITAFSSSEPQMHYLLQADAFLHGRLDIEPTGLTDLAHVDGRTFVAFPPAPALLLLPLVAVFGVTEISQILMALGLAAATLWALHRLLSKLELHAFDRPWLILAFTLGTGYWFALIYAGNVWFMAHIVAILFMLLALSEAVGGGRAWLVGAFLGFALLSRQLAVTLVPLLAALLWLNGDPSERKRRLVEFGLPLIAAVSAYLAFNAARFGSPLDSGYSHIALTGFLAERAAEHGQFSLSYLPFNLVYMFLQGFHLDFTGPLHLQVTGADPFGTSLFAASPFLLAAFWANGRRAIQWAAWLGIAGATLVMLLYYNNGWFQLNTQRFMLDILPALFYLAVRGSHRWPSAVFRGAIVYAVALNVLTLVVLPFLS